MVNYSHVYANMRNDLFANTFPNITRWVTEQGWIEIGQDENSKSLVRAIDPGGLVWKAVKNKHLLMMLFMLWKTTWKSGLRVYIYTIIIIID